MQGDKYGVFFTEYDPNERRIPPHKDPDKKPSRKRRRRKRILKRVLFLSLCFALVLLVIIISAKGCSNKKNQKEDTASAVSDIVSEAEHTLALPEYNRAVTDENSVKLNNEINSKYAVLTDDTNGRILAFKEPDKRIFPASMTKVMTVLVAAENVDSIDGVFKMTSAIINPFYKQGATLAGFGPGEEVRIEDLFYGAILESGAEAAYGLALYVSGTEEDFVKLMNEKAEQLGLKDTHFCNVSGMHDKEHYTTCNDMAVIMQAAVKNSFCRKVLSTEYYTVAANSFHDELKFHSTMFSRMYGTEPEVATILGGKTGFTANSGNCLASFGITDDGRTVICVTADGEGKYKPIYDCIALYKNFTHPNAKNNNIYSEE